MLWQHQKLVILDTLHQQITSLNLRTKEVQLLKEPCDLGVAMVKLACSEVDQKLFVGKECGAVDSFDITDSQVARSDRKIDLKYDCTFRPV